MSLMGRLFTGPQKVFVLLIVSYRLASLLEMSVSRITLPLHVEHDEPSLADNRVAHWYQRAVLLLPV